MPYIRSLHIGMLACLVCVFQQSAHQLAGRTFYLPRSQGNNGAREIVQFSRYLYPSEKGPWHAHALFNPGYAQSFRSERIAGYYFNTSQLCIFGSQTGERAQNAFLADTFGLSPAFQSVVNIKPSIRTFVGEFDLYGCYDFLYLRVRLPAVHTRWHFSLDEEVEVNGRLTPYPALYMATPALGAPYDSFKEAMCSNQAYGDVKEGLKYGKICGSRTKSGLADVHIDLGWHGHCSDRYYGGLYLRVVAPTGSHPSPEFLFNPVVGNGHHVEIGVGALGRILLWECEGRRQISLFGSLNVTHLLSSHECRSFDLCRNGFASRYLLLKQFDESNQYTRTLIPAINVTTLPCCVSAHANIDGVVMFGYQDDHYDVNLGYNYWIRTKENICLKGEISGRYGVKGIQNVDDGAGNPSNDTQSTATIYGNELTHAEQVRTVDVPSPVILATTDLDITSGESPRAFSQKIFLSIGRQWPDVEHVIPYVDIGGEVEFEGIAPIRFCQANYNTVSQWGIWLKGGVYI